MAKDPVCNMNVDENNSKYTSEINGNSVYLCSSACKQQLTKILQNMDTKESQQFEIQSDFQFRLALISFFY